MKKLILSITLCFALTGFLRANTQPIEPPEQSKPVEQVEQSEKKIPRLRIGANIGVSVPAEAIPYSFYYGLTGLGTLDYQLSEHTYIYSQYIYNEYKLGDASLVTTNSKNEKPIKIKSISVGYGFKTGTNFAIPSFRMGIGPIFNVLTQDEFTIQMFHDKIIVPSSTSSTLGLDLMLGFEIPFGTETCGLTGSLNFSSGIIGTDSGFKILYTSLGLFGLYFRI